MPEVLIFVAVGVLAVLAIAGWYAERRRNRATQRQFDELASTISETEAKLEEGAKLLDMVEAELDSTEIQESFDLELKQELKTLSDVPVVVASLVKQAQLRGATDEAKIDLYASTSYGYNQARLVVKS